MKKIPTVFRRVFDDNHKIIDILPEITPGCETAFLYGVATVKFDGACCAIYHGDLYKRFDAKPGKNPPAGAIPCQDEPDEITGHFPHWVKCDRNNPADKWFFSAWKNSVEKISIFQCECNDKFNTFEAVGKHFNGNPYHFLRNDYLFRHGSHMIPELAGYKSRTFENIRKFLENTMIEGIVFWFRNEPVCKIKRTDFGFSWNGKGGM